MLKIVVTTPDLKDLQEDIHSSVLKGLSNAASAAAFKVRADLPKRFTIRNGYVTRGIRYSKATPGKPYAEVYSKDDFMAKQEDGGSFNKDGHRFAIPRGIRNSDKTVITRTQRPKYILDNKRKIFKSDITGKYKNKAPHKNFEGIYMRRHMNQRLKILYLLTDKRTYKPRWEFEDTVEKIVLREVNRGWHGLSDPKYYWD